MNNMNITFYEYIWIDFNGKTRSKTMVRDSSMNSDSLEYLPIWNYDGSSTSQSTGKNTEINLYPIKITPDPFRTNSFLVLCDINREKSTRINAATIFDKYNSFDIWFGLEQEYFILRDYSDFSISSLDKIQGDYYCGVNHRDPIERDIAEEHLIACIYAGLNISGINAEVANGQWEFQVGIAKGIDAADQLFLARYILERIAEKHNRVISYLPKLDYRINGSGCHVNISTKDTRGENGIEYIYKYLINLSKEHLTHINYFGENNHQRLTGKHETSDYEIFSWGVGTRDTSVRIGNQTYADKKGYFEDRRPAANMNPYVVLSLIAECCCK
jgi:glutamine synthetase